MWLHAVHRAFLSPLQRAAFARLRENISAFIFLFRPEEDITGSSNSLHTLYDLKIMAHHTLQDIIKMICQRERLTWSPVADHHWHFSDMLASMLAAFCTHLVRPKLRRLHSSTSLSPYGCDTSSTHLYRQPCYYKLSRSSFLRLHNPMYWLLWKYWLNHVAIIIPI